MEITTTRSIHPLTAMAAVSVTLFSLAGIGAMTGLIPMSHSQVQPQPVAALEPAKPAEATRTATTAEPRLTEKIAAHKAAPKSVKPAVAATKPLEEPVKMAKYEVPAKYEAPIEIAQNAPVPRYETPKPVCYDCGRVESVREIEKAGDATGIGAIGGGVLGGALGHQTGGGRAKNVMAVLGAVGGAVAGNALEKHMKKVKSYEITIRFDDGSSQSITQDAQPSWHSGDKVKLINGVITSNS